METVSSVVSCLGWFLAAFRRKEIPEELAGRWFLERWLLGGKLNTSFGTRNVAWWAASKKKKSRCCGKRQFVETESFCLNACFSKFLSYTNKCPGQLPDGSSRRWSGLDGAYHPVSWPGAGMRHDLASQPISGPGSGLDTGDLGRQRGAADSKPQRSWVRYRKKK